MILRPIGGAADRWSGPRLLVFSTLLVMAGAPARAQNLVGTLQDQRAIEGCAWSASSSEVGAGLILLAEYDESVVVMNVEGADVRLSLDPGSQTGHPAGVGERVTKVYTAPSIRVEATYTATWVCPPNQEGCEVTRFDVTFVVRRGDQVETIRGAGDVGC